MDLYLDCPDHPADEMVYTKARLGHALRVFRETSSYLNKKGLPSENLERHLRSKYAFRKSSKVAPLTNVTLWQDKSNGSDDEEYDPDKERKTRNAKKKRRAEQKRKAEDSGDQERSIKKNKSEEGDHAYISFTLASEKGRQLLRDLSLFHKTDLESFDKERSDEIEPSYWKRYSSSSGSAEARRRPRSDVLLDDDLTETVPDSEPEKPGPVLTTSLRSGKVREKPSDKKITRVTNGMSKHDEDVMKESNPQIPRNNTIQKEVLPKWGISGRPTRGAGSRSEPIELDDDPNEEFERPAIVHHSTTSKCSTSGNHNTKFKREPSLPAVSPSNGFSFTQALSHPDLPGLITIETAYAHPIDFRFIPAVGQRCDFCRDWRFGILGHGKRAIKVFIDPEHPTQFQEMRNGHHSLGKQCTKMCISCALDRLLIMRCHCPNQDDRRSDSALPPQSQPAPAFSRISGVVCSKHNWDLYSNALFSKPGTAEASAPPSKNGPLSACSLCPAPAMWQCCKWQKTDKIKKPCRVPDEAAPATSAVTSLSSSPSTPPTTPSGGATNGHKKQASIISISDSDDDSPSTRPSATSSPQSSQRAHLTISSSSSQQGLRPPLRGCGLKMCTPCKGFVSDKCNGQLDKKLIMKWFRDESKVKEPRADVDWLFTGSLLERTYEDGARR